MNITKNHIIPFLQGKLNADEEAAVQQQIKQSSEFKKDVEDTRVILNITENLNSQKQIDTQSNWNKLSKRISWLQFRQKSWNITRTTAPILLPIVIIVQYMAFYLDSQDKKPVEKIEITSSYGLVSKITLPDGTLAWLNSGSKLIYPQKFEQERRIVHLSGEAYFNVKADQSNRFDVITSDNYTISAYGTEFNVSAYEDDEQTKIVLSEGHVDICLGNETKQLSVGQQALINKGNKNISISNANIYAQTAWKEGKMVFRRAKMDEIAKKLTRHFNIDIELKGTNIHSYEYSATFTTESLNEILYLLEQSAPLEWQSIEPTKQADFTYPKRKVIIQ